MEKPDPRSKGPRTQLTIRVPVDQVDIYERAAAQAGLSMSDYLVGQLARAHGLPEPEYLQHKRNARSSRRERYELPVAS